MRKVFFLSFICITLLYFSSCVTTSEAETEKAPVANEIDVPKEQNTVNHSANLPTPEEEIIAEFDGVTITKKEKAKAKSEIEIVVTQLNQITHDRDYERWLTYLSDSYKKQYSRPEELKKASESLPGIAKGIKLKDLSDYFHYVFVPSRQNGRVDDIKYLSPKKIRVLKKDKSQTLIFYSLENISRRWLLVP